MSQILVRNLDKELVDTLKKRAANNNRSLQVEVKSILEESSRMDQAMAAAGRRFKGLRNKFKDRGLEDSTSAIREERAAR